jgi:hypothetical protein
MQINQVNLSTLPPRARQTTEEALQPGSPNLYVSPVVSRWLTAQSPPSTLPQTYHFAAPASFYTATLPLSKTDLMNPKTKLAFETAAILTDAGGKLLQPDFPQTASALQGINIFVGGYSCLEKLLKPEKYSSLRRAFCALDVLLSVLNFLGNFVPQLKSASSWLLGIKVIVKVGDKIEEYNYRASEPQGKKILQALQESPELLFTEGKIHHTEQEQTQ